MSRKGRTEPSGEGAGNGSEPGGRARAPKRSLGDLSVGDLRGRRALVRVDYNVPLEDGEVADATRITATFPTLDYLLEGGSRPVLLAHLGRPGGSPDADLSLAPLARELERGLGRMVRFIGSPDSEEARRASREAEAGSVLLAENIRFLRGETENDPDLARRIARLGDLYVNDAFGASHRTHVSTVGVARLLRPAVAGFLVEAELEALDVLRTDPESPYVVVFGGAKIADKISLFEGMLERADRVLVGGGMANTFLAAQDREIGESLAEQEAVDAAGDLLAQAGEKLLLPTDLVVAPDPSCGDEARVVGVDGVPPDEMALDVGPSTRKRFADVVLGARTLFWNGPLGLFERPAFAEGTSGLARTAARAARDGAFVVVGGGDTARAVREAGVSEVISHVSTGGGAALEYLDRGTLPAVEVLEDA